jgi:GxxExxY protein
MDLNKLTEAVIGAAIEVHKEMGAGLLESTYEQCLCRELSLRGVQFECQKALPVIYKGMKLDCDYRVDVLVEGVLIVEVKSVEKLAPIHEAQLLTYLRLSGCQVGLLINFNVEVLRLGIKRMVNNFSESSSSASSAPLR